MTDDTFGETYLALLALSVGITLVVSLIPVVIAFWRGHPNRWIIFIISIVFGVTILGWLIALVWSLHGFHRDKATGSTGGASGLNLFRDDVKTIRIVGAAAGDVPRLDQEAHEAAPRVPALEQKTAYRSQLTVGEAAALIERLQALKAQGHLNETEAAAVKSSLIAQVPGVKVLNERR